MIKIIVLLALKPAQFGGSSLDGKAILYTWLFNHAGLSVMMIVLIFGPIFLVRQTEPQPFPESKTSAG